MKNQQKNIKGTALKLAGDAQKPTVTTKQFEDHIEYLKGELARATSQLNATRSGLATSEEALTAARSEIRQLQEELRAARAELQGKGAAPRGALPEPSLQSLASSFRWANHATYSQPTQYLLKKGCSARGDLSEAFPQSLALSFRGASHHIPSSSCDSYPCVVLQLPTPPYGFVSCEIW